MPIKSKPKVFFTIVDPRTIKITGGTNSIREHKQNNVITAIEMPSGNLFTIGNTVVINSVSIKINIIRKFKANNDLVYEICTAQRNKSSLLLMPMLGAVKHLYFYDLYLINCFIGTKEEGEGSIGLLYKNSLDPLFSKFKEAIKQFKAFNNFIELKDYIYFKFNVSKKNKKDYDRFIKGEYSKFSPKYKDDILKFHEIDIESQIAQILYKGKTRRKQLEDSLGVSIDPDAELFSIINEDLELFDKNYYL